MPGYPYTSALVTGASSGIGAAMVELLAAAGVPTVVVARRADRLQDLAARHDGLVEVLAADLASAAGVAAVAERLADPSRPVDLLVNNAGFGSSGPVAGTDSERLTGQIQVNVLALTQLTRAALPGMVERRRGWVLNVSSVASFQPAPNLAVYAATKAYVTSFTEALHEELRGTGVRATALCPGLTRTEFVQVSSGRQGVSGVPAVAWMSAEEVAATGLADAARGRAISVPGLQYRALVTASNFTPRFLARRVAGIITSR
jgi:uncharacterized protein